LNPVTRCMVSTCEADGRQAHAAQLEEVTLTTGLPGGNRNNDGTFNNVGRNGNFWSSSENNSDNAWNRNLNNDNRDLNRNNNNKRNGFSVRCLRD
jgi:uncharacterized protein (TIGR02145 family)